MAVDYKVVTSTTGLKDLEKTVQKHLSNGWKPLGGIAFNQGYPYQAIAKVVKGKPPEAPKKEAPKLRERATNLAADEYY